MEEKEDDQSDKGSYELVDFNDYLSDPEIQNMEDDVSNHMDHSDDGSYEILPSEDSDSDHGVLTEGEISNSTTDSDEAVFQGEASDSTTDSEDNMAIEQSSVAELRNSNFLDEEPELRFGRGLSVSLHLTELYPYRYPANIKCKSAMTIEDVVKDHVLRYLPAKSLARSRLVSREWNQWISGPFFAHIQSQCFKKISGFFSESISSINFISLDSSVYGVPWPPLHFLPSAVHIKSASNGLLLCEGTEDRFYVCNPANKQWVQLPTSGYYHETKPNLVLAFEPSPLNFKPCYHVICAFTHLDSPEGRFLWFDIYDSSTNSWRLSETVCFDYCESDLKGDGFFIDGVVYWETFYGQLLAFDLKNEIYGVQNLPLERRGDGGTMAKVHGELCYVEAQYHHSEKLCTVDVYKGSLMSLKSTMAFNISLRGLEDVECRVLPGYCDDVLAVLMNKYLYVYDVKSQKVEGHVVGSNFGGMSKLKLFPYINSLVRIAA